MPSHNTQKYDSKLAALRTFIHMQKVRTKVQPIAEILKMYCFCSLWACPDMPGHTHPKYDNQPIALMDLSSHVKKQDNSSTHCRDI